MTWAGVKRGKSGHNLWLPFCSWLDESNCIFHCIVIYLEDNIFHRYNYHELQILIGLFLSLHPMLVIKELLFLVWHPHCALVQEIIKEFKRWFVWSSSAKHLCDVFTIDLGAKEQKKRKAWSNVNLTSEISNVTEQENKKTSLCLNREPIKMKI